MGEWVVGYLRCGQLSMWFLRGWIIFYGCYYFIPYCKPKWLLVVHDDAQLAFAFTKVGITSISSLYYLFPVNSIDHFNLRYTISFICCSFFLVWSIRCQMLLRTSEFSAEAVLTMFTALLLELAEVHSVILRTDLNYSLRYTASQSIAADVFFDENHT